MLLLVGFPMPAQLVAWHCCVICAFVVYTQRNCLSFGYWSHTSNQSKKTSTILTLLFQTLPKEARGYVKDQCGRPWRCLVGSWWHSEKFGMNNDWVLERTPQSKREICHHCDKVVGYEVCIALHGLKFGRRLCGGSDITCKQKRYKVHLQLILKWPLCVMEDQDCSLHYLSSSWLLSALLKSYSPTDY